MLATTEQIVSYMLRFDAMQLVNIDGVLLSSKTVIAFPLLFVNSQKCI